MSRDIPIEKVTHNLNQPRKHFDKVDGELLLNLNRVSAYFAVEKAAIQIGEGADPPYIEMLHVHGSPLSANWDPANEIAPDLILIPTSFAVGKIEIVGERASDARLVTRVRLTTTSEPFRPMLLGWWRRIREALADDIRKESEQSDKIDEPEEEWWVSMVDREDVEFIRDWRSHTIAQLASKYEALAASITSKAYRLRKKYKAQYGEDRGLEIVPIKA